LDIVGLMPGFGSLIYTIIAFILALSVIVAIHEYGHYIVGRWSGIHAEVFSIGFGPTLISRRDRHGTLWQIAALPFGGYVRFLGDADAASAGKDGAALDDMDATALRRTMHGAPLWARSATVAAGPVFNFILSIIVFAAVIMFRGEATAPMEVERLAGLPAQQSVELRPGDRIEAIGGIEIEDIAALYGVVPELPQQNPLDYTVTRDGSRITVPGPYPFPALVEQVQPTSAAMDAGLMVGDVVTAIDGTPVTAFRQLQEKVAGSDGRALLLTVWREGETLEFALAPRQVDLPNGDGGFETRWLIGMTGGLAFVPATETPGPVAALGAGVRQTVFIVESSLSGLYHMITGAISSCNLRGPLGIAETSGAAASQGAQSFIWFIAVLSTAVGLLNLFPIPVLDGGHLVFYAYEAVAGKPPSDGALRVLMGVGLALLLSLMAFALTNDLFCP
jgi:regulator of sigma E protease